MHTHHQRISQVRRWNTELLLHFDLSHKLQLPVIIEFALNLRQFCKQLLQHLLAYLYNLEEGFAQTSLDKKQGWHRAKLKDGTGFYWLPPSLPGWAIPASDNKPSPENTNQKSPSVDCEQILKDFSDYAATETDKKKLIERYQRDWQLMAGNEDAQAKCVQVMNIRVNELKQAA